VSRRCQSDLLGSLKGVPGEIALCDVFKPDVIERFRAGVRLADWGCLEWVGTRTGTYGKVRVNGRTVPAHRVAWMMRHYREIPTGLVIDHLCCNKSCVNADHLEAVTDAENIRRVHRAPRGWQPVPNAAVEIVNTLGRRHYFVSWKESDFNGKAREVVEHFDDPEEAAYFAEQINRRPPKPVDELPFDIKSRLYRVLTDAAAEAWPNQPHAKLGNRKPIDLIRRGRIAEVRAVTDWMDDAKSIG
jgi:hypothetical protein